MTKYETFIIDWLVENRNLCEQDIDLKANIFAKEYLDSLSVFALVMEIEDTFEIQFDPEELYSDDAATINGLASITENKVNSDA